MNILFLGTCEFAKKCLDKLLSDSQFHVTAVLTKPPSPSGRGMKQNPSPVHILAQNRSIPVFTPHSLKNKKSIEHTLNMDIHAAIVVSYGLILPEYFLKKFPCVNIHPSLLPRWRGAAPIERCLQAGDSHTGVTLQKISPRLDAGDIIHQLSFPIPPSMSSEDIDKQIEAFSFQLLSQFLPPFLRGESQAHPQDESLVVYADKINKSEMKIDWQQSANSLFHHIRAFSRIGGAFTYLKGKRLKIFKTAPPSLLKKEDTKKEKPPAAGTILFYNKEKGWTISCGQGVLELLEVQWEGKKRQSIHEFIKGCRIQTGEVFSS